MAVTTLAPSVTHKLSHELIATPSIEKSSAHSHQSRRRPRAVTFDESRNTAYVNEQLSAEESRQTWINQVDYQAMKDAAYSHAKQIWKKERRMVQMEGSYSNSLLRVYDACCEATQESAATSNSSILSPQDQQAFAHMIGKANTRTGLEKICIREIAYDKRQRRFEATDLVLHLQQQGRSSASAAALMALSCQTVSRASRLFAREMAVALATSLQQQD